MGADPFPEELELLLLRFVADGVRFAAAAVLLGRFGLADPPDFRDPPDFADPPDCPFDAFARCADFWLF